MKMLQTASYQLQILWFMQGESLNRSLHIFTFIILKKYIYELFYMT